MKEIPLVDIAIAGKLGSAKTYCSNLLVEKHGYRRLSFATPLKRILRYAREEKWLELGEFIRNEGPYSIEVKASRALTNIIRWWVDHREDKDFVNGKGREFLQYFGTDYFRKLDPDYLVKWFKLDFPIDSETMDKPADRQGPIKVFVVDDVRFPNELECVRNIGFLTLRCDVSDEERSMRVSREDLACMNHSSECMLDGMDDYFDGVIDTSCRIEAQYDVLMAAIWDAYSRKIGGS